MTRRKDPAAARTPLAEMEAQGHNLPDFAPVPVKFRHDGWTPERQRAFIGALADTGSVKRAGSMRQGAAHPPVAAAVLVLGLLRIKAPPAAQRLTELANEGILQARMNEAFGANMEALAARLAALQILYDRPLGAPNNLSWEQRTKESPQLFSLIDSAIREFSPDDQWFHHLADQVGLDTSTLPLVRSICSAQLDRKELGLLYVDRIISDVDTYLALFDEIEHLKFVSKITSYSSFWEKLEAAGLSPSAKTIYRHLIDNPEASGTVRTRARKGLREMLSAQTQGAWEQSITTDDGVIQLSRNLQEVLGRPIALGEPLFKALSNLMANLIASEQRDYVARWFEAIELLSASGRKTFLRNLRDQLLSMGTIPNLVQFLRSWSEATLKQAEFADKGDDAVRHILVPLFESPDGIAWTLEHVSHVSAWMKTSSPETKDFVQETVQNRWSESAPQERSRLELIAKECALPKPG